MIDHPPALIDCSKHNLKLMNVHQFKNNYICYTKCEIWNPQKKIWV